MKPTKSFELKWDYQLRQMVNETTLTCRIHDSSFTFEKVIACCIFRRND